jgi:hypothetical protein
MSSNPREHIGANSDGAEPSDTMTPEQEAEFRKTMIALNSLRQERRGLGDDERDVKQQLKEKGFSARAQAIANRARKSRKEDPHEVIEQALQCMESDATADERAELDRIADLKKDISKQERELRNKAKELGIETRTLPIVRAMQDMDSIERGEFFDGIVNQCRALRFW